MVTCERLKELLSYNPQTGDFTWLVAVSDKIKIGRVAGSADGHGYRRIKVDGREYQAHRLAWLYQTGSWPRHQIDHIDRNRSNNAISNLREATRSQNAANTLVRRDNKLGIKGVIWHRNRYVANLSIGGVAQYIGVFKTAEEAKAAYDAAAQKAFGDFARVGLEKQEAA